MSSAPPLHFRGPRAERIIVAARAVLAASSLFAIWLDPAEPARYAALTYALHSGYVIYALLLAGAVWRRVPPARLPIVTHVADIVVFSVFQYLTLGPSSPFFVYFIFSLFCAAVRWGWRGTMWTAAAVLATFLTMGASMSRTLGATEFELNRFIIRLVYLAMVAWLLIYLGQHETRLRHEIQRLARWPGSTDGDVPAVTARLLQHAAGIVGAPRAVVVWDTGDEPWLDVASWSAAGSDVERHAPTTFDPLVTGPSAAAAFVCDARSLILHPGFRSRLGDGGVASAPFRTDRVSGRAFFCGLHEPTSDLVSLVEVVVRELGASLGELVARAQLQQIAIREERIRVARDLHDGILQSMTGIRFELQAIAQEEEAVAAPLRARLHALERTLASEQRELRLFIDDLKPLSLPPIAAGMLLPRLEDIRQRLADEWKIPILLRAGALDRALPRAVEGAVPLIVQEGIVNALKHARPSKVTVEVGSAGDALAIAVIDDGIGFPFRGRYDHATLQRQNVGPATLRERVAALGGRLSVDSAATGSRVDIELPLTREDAEWRFA